MEPVDAGPDFVEGVVNVSCGAAVDSQPPYLGGIATSSSTRSVHSPYLIAKAVPGSLLRCRLVAGKAAVALHPPCCMSRCRRFSSTCTP